MVSVLLAGHSRDPVGEQRLWLVAGFVVGVALLNKPLIAFLLVGVAVGLLAAGPRHLLRCGWLWAALAIALVVWSPWVLWQGHHGWPQLHVSSSIAKGGSASSQPRWALVPFQFLLVSPVLAPVWLAGLVALLRRSRLRPFRFFAISWVVLVVIFLATGGKPYYLAGMFPVLLAAGAIETDNWLAHGNLRLRSASLVSAIVLSGLVSAVIALPILPAADAGPVIAVNEMSERRSAGQTSFGRSPSSITGRSGSHVIFTSNYGEAGAIDRYGPSLDLPSAYSGHNGFANWGPPPDRLGQVVVVGLDRGALDRQFQECHLALRVTNSAGVDNDENGTPIDVCHGTRGSWTQNWDSLRHLG